MSGHTKGPWTHEGPDEFLDFNIVPAGEVRAIAGAVSNLYSREEIIANANLIAAAPELLHVAKAYEAWEADVILNAEWGANLPRLTQAQWDRLVEVQVMRNAAITKAEGRA